MSESADAGPPLSTRVRRLATAGVALAAVYSVSESAYGSTAVAVLAVVLIASLAVTGRS